MTALLASGFLLVVLVAMSAVAVVALSWMVHAWKTPNQVDVRRLRHFARAEGQPLSFSLIVPARHEERVLGRTLAGLARQTHRHVEVIVVVGDDDPDTMRAAEEAQGRYPKRVHIVIDYSWKKSKPKALNRALEHVRGDVVAVFDAEDEVHPDLVLVIDRYMRRANADVIQAGVQLVNFWSSWFALHNTLEYFFWYRSRLHMHAAIGATPLGGNTVFVRTELVRRLGGWDADCLTEDADLGIRVSAAGSRVAVVYDPDMVTREEAPDSLASLLRQRTRWNQGFLQVLRKGDWRRLPRRRQRLLALFTLASPYIQAPMLLMIPASVVSAATLKVPIGFALLSWMSAIPLLATLAVEAVGLNELSRTLGTAMRARDYMRLVLGFWPYQLVLTAAAVRAAWRQLTGQLNWEKTEHCGAHRVPGLAFGGGDW